MFVDICVSYTSVFDFVCYSYIHISIIYIPTQRLLWISVNVIPISTAKFHHRAHTIIPLLFPLSLKSYLLA